MAYTTLVSPDAAAPHLEDPHWLFVDCRFDLADPGAGRRAYETTHIPGAVYVDLDDDLSGAAAPPGTGRHPLPAKREFEKLLSRLGVRPTTQVVAYDDAGGTMAAARLWWMLRWAGHDSSAVLDGGFSGWIGRGSPVATEVPRRRPSTFVGHWRDDLLVDAEAAAAAARRGLLVDSRAADRYRGDNEPIDPVAGHIPGAISFPYGRLLTDDSHLLPRQNLASELEAITPPGGIEQAVFYCGSGVTSAHTVLAATHATGAMPKLYAGSWSDWITDPRRPVERGDPPRSHRP